jgi:hypothetical protein
LSWDDPRTLFGGDAIWDFENHMNRDGFVHASIPSGLEYFTDYGLMSGVPYHYSLITRLTTNDSTSVPVNISVIPIGGDCVVGDVNGDQIINLLDVINVLLFALEHEIPDEEGLCAADMDFDGEVTINDVLRLVDIVLGRP